MVGTHWILRSLVCLAVVLAAVASTKGVAQAAVSYPADRPRDIGADAELQATIELADRLSRFLKQRCERQDSDDYLTLIADLTVDTPLQRTTSALRLLEARNGLCAGAQTAISSALQSAILAQAASSDAVAAVNPIGTPFSIGGVGPTSFGGGSGYVSQ